MKPSRLTRGLCVSVMRGNREYFKGELKMKKIILLVIALIVIVGASIAYQDKITYFQPQANDVIAFSENYNGPIVMTSAYILREDSEVGEQIREMKIPSELQKSRMNGKYYDNTSQTLFFTNDAGFFAYNLKQNAVKTINQGVTGYTFKVENGIIFYNLDIGIDHMNPSDGYQNQLCEYTLVTTNHQCYDLVNVQAFDVLDSKDAYYVVGYTSDLAGYTNMVNSLQVYERETMTLVNVIEIEQEKLEGRWFPTLFINDEGSLIINNDGVSYHEYVDGTVVTLDDSTYQMKFSNSTSDYMFYGGDFTDYDVSQDCTRIAKTLATITCTPGMLNLVPMYGGNQMIPDNNGFLSKSTWFETGEMYINVIDLTTLQEVRRIQLDETHNFTRHFIYLSDF